jgi:uncharacterized Tic20 family protein
MMIAAIILVITLIGILLLAFLGILVFVLVLIATLKASEGKTWKYPLTLRLIK